MKLIFYSFFCSRPLPLHDQGHVWPLHRYHNPKLYEPKGDTPPPQEERLARAKETEQPAGLQQTYDEEETKLLMDILNAKY